MELADFKDKILKTICKWLVVADGGNFTLIIIIQTTYLNYDHPNSAIVALPFAHCEDCV